MGRSPPSVQPAKTPARLQTSELLNSAFFPHIAFISLGTEHIRVLRPRPHARVFSDAPYPQENVTKLESHFTRRPSRYRRGLPPRRGRARHFWCFSFPRFILSPAQLEALNLTREACLHVPKKKKRKGINSAVGNIRTRVGGASDLTSVRDSKTASATES